MENIKILPKMLKGSVYIPPSKSVAHRAIILASLSEGLCKIKNVQLSDDIKATIGCVEKMGVICKFDEEKRELSVDSTKLFKKKGNMDFDCVESGSTLRFLIPITLLAGKKATFTGRGRLLQRPQKPYFDIFDEKGIAYRAESDYISVYGDLQSGEYHIAGDISSQFITGLLFALSKLDGDSTLKITTHIESKGYIDLSVKMLKDFGIEIKNDNYESFFIKGGQKFKSIDYTVESDYSQAAFFLVAGALGCDVECIGLKDDSLQGDREILEIIEKTGAKIIKTEKGIKAVRGKEMKGFTLNARDIPDLVPVVAVLFAFCEGESCIVDAERLRIKESDRLAAISSELKRLGADVNEGYSFLKIRGSQVLSGGEAVSAWGDHRIAMALAIAACRTEGYGVEIVGAGDAVKKSYPEFFEVYEQLTQ